MTLAMARPWKHPDTGIYWLRKRVPNDLRDAIGKREEKRSLGTRNPDEAKRRHAAALAKLEAEWSNLRRGAVALTRSEAFEIASGATRDAVDDLVESFDEQSLWRRFGLSLFPTQTLPAPVPAAEDLADSTKTTDANPFVGKVFDLDWEKKGRLRAWCLSLAERTLIERGLFTDAAGRTLVARYIARAMYNASDSLWRSMTEPRQRSEAPESGRVASNVSRPDPRPDGAVPFQTLFEGWAAETKPSQKTQYSWNRVVAQLCSFVHHDDARRMTPEDLIAWKGSMVQLGLHPKTIRDGKLAPVRAIFQWGVDNRRLEKNPAERITIDVKLRPGDRRRGYDENEAGKILAAALKQALPHRRWVPWVCAYSGARLSEVCQLRAEDVLLLEEIQCVRFAPEAGSLKNANSERTIPLHPAVLNRGFMKFVESVGSGPLFSELRPDRFGSRGGRGTKSISEWIRALGLVDPRIAPSHSWRHRFKTLARKYGLATDIVDSILGHQRRTVGDTYGDFPMLALYRELHKIPTLELT